MTRHAWFEFEGRRIVCRVLLNGDAETVTFQCPRCGRGMFLPQTVTLGEGGKVTASPSVVCPHDVLRCPNDACNWHVTIKDGVAA